MSTKNYNNINVKKEINSRYMEAIYGKFIWINCGIGNFNDVIVNNLSTSYGSFTNITGTSLTYTNGSFTNLISNNLNLNNTTISNISITKTTLSNIPYVRYNDSSKQILYKNNHYGEFISITSQTAITNDIKVLTYDIYNSYGIIFNNSNPSRITIAQPGLYKIGTSIQFDRSTGSPSGKAQCYFWFRKNNQNIDNSSSAVYISNKNEIQCGYAEIIQSLNKDDWIEVVIGAEIHNIDAHYAPATTLPSLPKPAIPSVVTTIYQLD